MESSQMFNSDIKSCTHEINCSFYCQLCKSLYCEECRKYHKNHLEEEINYNNFIKTLIFKLEFAYETANTSLENFENILSNIDKKFNEIIENLLKQKEKLKENIKKVYRIDDNKENLNKNMDELLKHLEFFKKDIEVQQKNKVIEYYNKIYESKINESLEEIRKINVNLDKQFASIVIDDNFFEELFEIDVPKVTEDNLLMDQKFIDNEGYRYKYSGDHLNGIPHGKGKQILENGWKYEGEFKNGKRDGKGIMFYKRRKYEGEWKDDLRHGIGKMVMYSGRVYQEGIWQKGVYDNQKCIIF